MCYFWRKINSNQDISNIPFIMRGTSFSCPRTQNRFTSYYMHFSPFKICSQFSLVSAILHYISLLRLLPKSYFNINTFQPNFLCSSSFKNNNRTKKFVHYFWCKVFWCVLAVLITQNVCTQSALILFLYVFLTLIKINRWYDGIEKLKKNVPKFARAYLLVHATNCILYELYIWKQ